MVRVVPPLSRRLPWQNSRQTGRGRILSAHKGMAGIAIERRRVHPMGLRCRKCAERCIISSLHVRNPYRSPSQRRWKPSTLRRPERRERRTKARKPYSSSALYLVGGAPFPRGLAAVVFHFPKPSLDTGGTRAARYIPLQTDSHVADDRLQDHRGHRRENAC
jgi:hypothetical protein